MKAITMIFGLMDSSVLLSLFMDVCLSDQNGWSSEKVGDNSICDLLEVESLVSNNCPSDNFSSREGLPRNCWMPIGWARVSELVQTVQRIGNWSLQSVDFLDGEDGIAVTDMATLYWERPVSPTWWCHVDAGHLYINSWLSSAHWLHPAINLALQDEYRLISDRMKHLLYEVPVRVASGLLFELLGQSAGNPHTNGDDIPVVLRSWQVQNFLLTTLHVKGSASNLNVIGIAEVQTAFRTHEDMYPFSIILLNQEITRLSTQLLQHYKGNSTRGLLEEVIKSTRTMIEEQVAERGHLFTIQDVMQRAVRPWFAAEVLVLTIITGIFGINVDGLPEAEILGMHLLFTGILFLIGAVLVGIVLLYLGFKKPISDEYLEKRKLELEDLVKMFEQGAESHAQMRKTVPPTNPSAACPETSGWCRSHSLKSAKAGPV